MKLNTTIANRWIWALILPMTFLLCVIGIPAISVEPIPHSAMAISYYTLIYISQNFLFAVLLSILLWLLSYLIYFKRILSCLSVIFISSVILFFVFSAKIFSFWHFYTNATLFNLFFSKGGGTTVFEISPSMYVTLAGVIFIFFITGWIVFIIANKLKNKLLITLFLSIFFASYIIAQSMTVFLIRNQVTNLLQYTIKVPYFIELSWATILDHVGVPVFPKLSLSDQLRNTLSTDNQLKYPLEKLHYHIQKHPLNVLIIALDTLRADMLNPINMPNVYHFSQSADRFTNQFSGGDCTQAGIFSLFYSIPATYWDNATQYHQNSIVIRAFLENHYRLGIFGSAGFLSPPFAKNVFFDVPQLQLMPKGQTAFERDQQITSDMQNFLSQRSKDHKPFFSFVFYDGPHAYNTLHQSSPFKPIASMNYVWVNNKTNPIPLFNLYKNAVFKDDQLVKKLLQTLKNTHLLSNTVVIITSDHGQEFNEYHNNYWEHPTGFSTYQMHVPMVIKWPGRKPMQHTEYTTHFDIAPTLLRRILGVTNPINDYSVGKDLYTPHQFSFLIADQYEHYAIITPHFVMPFFKNGLYRFTDITMKPIDPTQLNGAIQQGAFEQLRRFY